MQSESNVLLVSEDPVEELKETINFVKNEKKAELEVLKEETKNKITENIENLKDEVSDNLNEKVGKLKDKVDEVGDLIKNLLGDNMDDFSASKIPALLPKMLIHVRKLGEMTGDEKKDYIVKVLRRIVDETDGPGNDEIWDPILKQLIPGMVDTLLDVENGRLRLRQKKKCCLFFWK